MGSTLKARNGFGVNAPPLRNPLLRPSQLFPPRGEITSKSLRQTREACLLCRHRVVLKIDKDDGR